MTMKHGTKPSTKPNKSYSDDVDQRKRGVKPTMPARDGTTRTEGVSQKHRSEDQHSKTLQAEYEDRLTDL